MTQKDRQIQILRMVGTVHTSAGSILTGFVAYMSKTTNESVLTFFLGLGVAFFFITYLPIFTAYKKDDTIDHDRINLSIMLSIATQIILIVGLTFTIF